jgi:hypothetical protein
MRCGSHTASLNRGLAPPLQMRCCGPGTGKMTPWSLPCGSHPSQSRLSSAGRSWPRWVHLHLRSNPLVTSNSSFPVLMALLLATNCCNPAGRSQGCKGGCLPLARRGPGPRQQRPTAAPGLTARWERWERGHLERERKWPLQQLKQHWPPVRCVQVACSARSSCNCLACLCALLLSATPQAVAVVGLVHSACAT